MEVTEANPILTEERRQRIGLLVEVQGSVTYAELSRSFGVSRMTLYRDLKALEAKIRAQARRSAERKAHAEQLREILEPITLTLRVKAGETKIYGSVTGRDLVTALEEQHQISLDPKRLALEKPIKELGNYTVTYKPHPEVPMTLKVTVVANK